MQDMVKYALAYRRKLNWCVIPVVNKKPIVSWSEFQKRLPTEEEIKEWWTQTPGANIALITGKISGVVVFDCDDANAVQYVKDKGIENTAIAQSGKGEHFYFQYPTGWKSRINNKNCRGLGIDIDIKADGGSVTLPPSMHKSGKRYKWISSPTNGIAKLDFWQLELIDKRKRFQGKLGYKKNYEKALQLELGASDGMRNDSAYRLAKEYIKLGMPKHVIIDKLLNWRYKTENYKTLSKKEIQATVTSALGHRR